MNAFHRRFLSVCALAVVLARTSFAEPPQQPPINGPPAPAAPKTLARDAQGRVTLRATRISTPLRVDGRLDEDNYRSTQPITGFIQGEPSHGAPATEETAFWIFFDDDKIYVGVRCYDSAPETQWVANEMRRDSFNIGRNEGIALYFDTFLDRRNAFLFQLSAIGGIYDATVTNERLPGNIDYNPVWEREVGRFDKGWTAEMAIPFRALRYKPGRDQVWGINVRRTVRWKNEESFIQPLPPSQVGALFQISLGGTLVGIDAPAAGRNLDIKPYAIAGVTSDLRASPPVSNSGDAGAGFDIKYGVTPNLTADLTVRTDFAQVEVDEQQVNLTRFPLFFPEKREFFLEGQSIFDFGGATSSATNVGSNGSGLTPLLFFSRRIGLNDGDQVPVDAGGRLTGKVGKFTLALVDVQTGDTSTTPSTNFSVLRVKRDVLRRSSVGLLYTGRSHNSVGGGAATQAFGVDAAMNFFDNLNFNAYYARSETPGVDEDDASYRAQLYYNGDRYGVQYERLVVGDGFIPDVGFLRRADFGRHFGLLRFSPRPRRSRLVRRYTYSGSYDYIANRAGRLETREVAASYGIAFQNGDSLNVNAERNYEDLANPFPIASGVRIPVGGYSFGSFSGGVTLGNQRKVSGTVTVSTGSFYSGDRTTLSYSGGRINLSPRVSVEPGLSINWIDLAEGEFTTALFSSRGTFTVTPRMFITGLVQYNSSARAVSTNLRARWEYHPGSELFVVYTDERDTAPVGLPDLKNRAFVVKINRLLQF